MLAPLASMVAVYLLLALSFLIVLRMGELSFGQQAYFGIGAYGAAVLTVMAQWDLLPALIAAALTAGGAALLVGLVALRMSGFQFSVFTLVIGELVRTAFGRWSWQVRVDGHWVGPEGTMGFAGIDHFARHDVGVNAQAAITVGVATAVVVAVAWLAQGRRGRLLAAVACDRTLADARGIPSDRLRLQAHTLAGVVAGFGGALFAPIVTFIDPDHFGIMVGVHALAYTLVGGIGHVAGALAGTLLDVGLLEAMRALGRWRMVGFGLLIIVMLILMPRGIFATRRPTRVQL
jgi:branched-chain amino acid transport system permease protein